MVGAEDELCGCDSRRFEDWILEHDSPFDGRLAAVRADPCAEPLVELFRHAVRGNWYSWRRVRQVRVAERSQENCALDIHLQIIVAELHSTLDLRQPLVHVAEERHHLCGFEDVRHRGRGEQRPVLPDSAKTGRSPRCVSIRTNASRRLTCEERTELTLRLLTAV